MEKVLKRSYDSKKGENVRYDRLGNAHVSFAGSRTWKDWLRSDVLLGLGMERFDPRFKAAKRFVRDIHRKNPGKKVTTYGHSLGGALAEHAAYKNDTVKTYNKGMGLTALFRPRRKNQYDYHRLFDPVSYFSRRVQRGRSSKRVGWFGHSYKSSSWM